MGPYFSTQSSGRRGATSAPSGRSRSRLATSGLSYCFFNKAVQGFWYGVHSGVAEFATEFMIEFRTFIPEEFE